MVIRVYFLGVRGGMTLRDTATGILITIIIIFLIFVITTTIIIIITSWVIQSKVFNIREMRACSAYAS